MDLGAEWAGCEVIWANEMNPYACDTFENNNVFKNTKLVRGSIEDIDLDKELPKPRDVDIILGGFPCQDISCIGRQRGIIEGGCSTLFYRC